MDRRSRSSRKKVENRTTVVTSSIRTSSSSISGRTESPVSHYQQKVYPWETSPKTGYTYADSGSYKVDRLEDPYLMPNMSRSPLRDQSYSSTSSISRSTVAESREEREGSYIMPNVVRQSNRHLVDSSRFDESLRSHESLQKQSNMTREDINMSSHNPNSSQFEGSTRDGHRPHSLRLPPSTTRQGTNYGMKGRLFGSGGNITKRLDHDQHRRRTIAMGKSEQSETVEFENTAYKEYEKQLEYSGAPSPHKEGSIDHLYGLDHEYEEDVSDEEGYVNTDQVDAARSSSSSSIVTTICTTIFYSIITVISAIVTTTVEKTTSLFKSYADAPSQQSAASSADRHADVDFSEESTHHIMSTRSRKSHHVQSSYGQDEQHQSQASHQYQQQISSGQSSFSSFLSSTFSIISSVSYFLYNVVKNLLSSVVKLSYLPLLAAKSVLSTESSESDSASAADTSTASSSHYDATIYHEQSRSTLHNGATDTTVAGSGVPWFARYLYKIISWTTLTDAWLLSGAYYRRRGGCCCLLPLLLLLPIFLIGRYYVYEHGSQWFAHGGIFTQKQVPLIVPPGNDSTQIIQYIQNYLLLQEQKLQKNYMTREEFDALTEGLITKGCTACGDRFYDKISQNRQADEEKLQQGIKVSMEGQQTAVDNLKILIQNLQGQLESLKALHTNDMEAVKSCCQDKTYLLGLVKEQIQTDTSAFMTEDDLKKRLALLQTELDATLTELKVQIESRPGVKESDSDEQSSIEKSLVLALLEKQKADYEAQLAVLRVQLEDKMTGQATTFNEKLEKYFTSYDNKLSGLESTMHAAIEDMKTQIDINIVDQKTKSDDEWGAAIEQLKKGLSALKIQVNNTVTNMKTNIQVQIESSTKSQDDNLAVMLQAYGKRLDDLKLKSDKAVADVQNNIDVKFATFQTSDDNEVKSAEFIALGVKLEDLRAKMDELLAGVKSDIDLKISEQATSNNENIAVRLTKYESKLKLLRSELNEEQRAHTDEKISAHMKMVNAKLEKLDSDLQDKIAAYLSEVDNKFVTHDEQTRNDIKQQILQAVSNTYNNYTVNEQKVHVDVSPGTVKGGITQKEIMIMINDALKKFGADRTGMVDYALESAGGSVISTRCSETYHRRTAQISLFGIPLWYMNNSPRTVLQPDMQPGQCWAFKGQEGYLVIQLSGWVLPTAFTMEHIPKSLSADGKIDSAPKDFTVYGLKNEQDIEGVPLGNYTYDENGEALQTFPVQAKNTVAFNYVELRITSNQNNEEYTCLYRFRVHGDLQKM